MHIDVPSPLVGEGSDSGRYSLTWVRVCLRKSNSNLNSRSEPLIRRFAPPSPTGEEGGTACVAKPNYRTTLAASSSRSVALAVASTVPFSAISLASTNAMVLPSCLTVASPMIGPGFAGAKKFTVMLIVVV